MNKLDEAMEALKLFPNITPEIMDYLLAPLIEEQEREEERTRLKRWLTVAKNIYKHRLVACTRPENVIVNRVNLAELEAYIDRL